MDSDSKDINSDILKSLAEVSKQNSDSILKQTENITKLTEGQESIVKSLTNFGENITKTITETLKQNIHESDNNNPTGPGIGMKQNVKPSSDKDVGDKTTAPNAYAPGEYGSTGRGGNEPASDKGGLKMENKTDDTPKKEEMKTDDKPKEEMKEHGSDYKEEDKTKKEDKPKEETKTDDDKEKKTDKYKSFNYEDNEPLRPAVMTKSFEQYPDGYQIIKAALSGWGQDGMDAETSYVETLKRLDNREFGDFGHNETGGSYI